jgi:hypothetical protein
LEISKVMVGKLGDSYFAFMLEMLRNAQADARLIALASTALLPGGWAECGFLYCDIGIISG